MSPPAVATSIVATVFEGTAGPAKPDKPAEARPARSFAQTATLVNARQPATTDNPVIAMTPTGSLPAEDSASPVQGALSEPGQAAKPGKSEDRKRQGLEVLMQAAGWNTSACSIPSQLSTGQIGGSTSPKATIGGGSSPQQKRSAVSREVVAGGKAHAVELKEGDAKASAQSSARSNAQQVGTLDGPVPGIDQRPQPNRGRRDVEKSKPLTETPRGLQQSSRDVRSQWRASPATFGDSTQPHEVASETSTAAGGKDAALSHLGGDLQVQLEPVALGTDRSAVISHGVSDRTSTTGNLNDGPVAKGVAQSIGEQIHDSVRASLARGDQQVVIRLNPPELGSVIVRFEQQNEQIDGVLEVGRSETRNELEQALPQVLQSLQELGIQVRKLEVTVSDQPQGDLLRQQQQQDAWAQQQDSDPSPSPAQRSSLESRVSNIEAPAFMDVPVGRIDMLV